MVIGPFVLPLLWLVAFDRDQAALFGRGPVLVVALALAASGAVALWARAHGLLGGRRSRRLPRRPGPTVVSSRRGRP